MVHTRRMYELLTSRAFTAERLRKRALPGTGGMRDIAVDRWGLVAHCSHVSAHCYHEMKP